MYNQAGASPHPGTYFGPTLANIGNQAGQYAIYSQLANANPTAQRMAMWDPVMGTGAQPGSIDNGRSLSNYYRRLSPTN